MEEDSQLILNLNEFIIFDLIDKLKNELRKIEIIKLEEQKYKIKITDFSCSLCFKKQSEAENAIVKFCKSTDIENVLKKYLMALEFILTDEKSISINEINEIVKVLQLSHLEQLFKDINTDLDNRYIAIPFLINCDQLDILNLKSDLERFLYNLEDLEITEERYRIPMSDYSYELKNYLQWYIFALNRLLEISNIKMVFNETKRTITKNVFEIILNHYAYIDLDCDISEMKSIDLMFFIDKLHENYDNRQENIFDMLSYDI